MPVSLGTVSVGTSTMIDVYIPPRSKPFLQMQASNETEGINLSNTYPNVLV